MKKLKKLLSIVLVLTMVLSLNVVSFAASTYTITISNDADGYVYTAYQIFAGELSTDPETDVTTLSNITWGNGVNSSDTALLTALTSTYGTTVASEVAAKLTSESEAAAFARIVGEYLVADNGVDSTQEGSTYVIGLDNAGYYLVKNTTVPSDGAYTSYILEVVKSVEVDEKASVPSMTKNVMDKNDTTGATAGWQDTADYDVGDSIPFRLTGTVSSKIADYKSYNYIFHDVMSNGLELDTGVDVVVKIYPSYTTDTNGIIEPSGTGVVVESGYDVVTTDLSDSCSFEVQINDLLKCYDEDNDLISITATSLVVVEFNAKLTDKAVVGNNGNPNTAYLEYANDPYTETDTGSTPWDTNVVFTYKVDVNKVKSDGSVLTGAEFTLYKEVLYSTGDTGTFYSWDSSEGKYVEEASPDNGNKYCVLIGVLTGSGINDNEYSWSGLDAGDYVLVETVTPTGYNTMDNVKFTINATISNTYTAATVDDNGVNSYGEAYLTNLTANVTAGTDPSFTANLTDGSLTADVVNNAGSELPSTGGIGTTIFYVVGGILILGAVILLITKKRMNSEEK